MDDIETLLRADARRLTDRLGRDGMLREVRAYLGIEDALAGRRSPGALPPVGSGTAAGLVTAAGDRGDDDRAGDLGDPERRSGDAP